ncbi:selenide, water dikinase SelD [Gammaproteobacteria bacterium]|nr:selenide, water dikinase SelD [Gammaproteobacteria bacterium]
MKNMSRTPIIKHLVLIGGGHSHLAVLKRLGMDPLPGLTVTVITAEVVIPYSGALPNYISGHSSIDEMQLDLRPLVQFAGARLIEQAVTSIDFENCLISLDNRPVMDFDFISINIGSKPNITKIAGASANAIPVKPLNYFIKQWDSILPMVVKQAVGGTKCNFVIIGGGPASVELAFAIHKRLTTELKTKKNLQELLCISVITAETRLLARHNLKASRIVHTELEKYGVKIIVRERIENIEKNRVTSTTGKTYHSDVCIVATGASMQAWPNDDGLQCDPSGFIQVNNFLQSVSHSHVFASGDAASIMGTDLPKSGVYAVRQGKPLAENIYRYITGRKLRAYKPQNHALALLSMSNKRAIATRGPLVMKNKGAWMLKNIIDRKFLDKYTNLPEMKIELNLSAGMLPQTETKDLQNHAMRCAGCGAKVDGNILSSVLSNLTITPKPEIMHSGVEDASIISLENNRKLIQSIDQVSSFINDPWLFARIATNHCLSDIYAMGAKPHSVLASVGLPMASSSMTKRMLSEIMQGCVAALEENGVTLVGGHTAETSEMQIGLAVNGFASGEALMKKGGMKAGDQLIITKPIGSGTLLAADMRSKAKHVWVKAALNEMLTGNSAASEVFSSISATSCTDITGFGLAGHLVEMIEASETNVEIFLNRIPILNGALECIKNGIFSSLHKSNKASEISITNRDAFKNDKLYELLFDPQTAGGLLASIPNARVDETLKLINEAGYLKAQIIGRVVSESSPLPTIELTNIPA